MKILVMGLPGSGKTYLSERMQKHLECAWYNADAVREMANDWDFTPEGRMRQSTRMKTIADFEVANDRIVICDFVCPTEHGRQMFDADVTIWVNTIEAGRFEDTNKIFEKPQAVDYEITSFLTDEEIEHLARKITSSR
jgi:adenylylsulfate kinase